MCGATGGRYDSVAGILRQTFSRSFIAKEWLDQLPSAGPVPRCQEAVGGVRRRIRGTRGEERESAGC